MAIVVRVAAAAALIFGPWTDSADELTGWDTSRFAAIAEAPGRHWVDHAVEYPPGSVVIIEAVAGGGPVSALRIVVALSLAVDLGLAWFLRRAAGTRAHGDRAALAYLVIGTPMVLAGLVRLDLWAAALGTIGVVALARRQSAGVAVGAVAGAMVKIFPVLLVPIAVGARRFREAAAAVVVGALAGIAWLAYGGFDAIDQVLSLRGATGWHVETIPGSILALAGNEPRFEADAWRIGTIDETVVFALRVVALAVTGGLSWLLWRLSSRGDSTIDLRHLALAATGSIAALLLTAPLFSPQFMLWLTPFAALTIPTDDDRHGWLPLVRSPLGLTAAAALMTAVVLGIFSPEGVDHPIAALALLGRDALLVALVAAAGRDLYSAR